jgi:hypothetical protein
MLGSQGSLQLSIFRRKCSLYAKPIAKPEHAIPCLTVERDNMDEVGSWIASPENLMPRDTRPCCVLVVERQERILDALYVDRGWNAQ